MSSASVPNIEREKTRIVHGTKSADSSPVERGSKSPKKNKAKHKAKTKTTKPQSPKKHGKLGKYKGRWLYYVMRNAQMEGG